MLADWIRQTGFHQNIQEGGEWRGMLMSEHEAVALRTHSSWDYLHTSGLPTNTM